MAEDGTNVGGAYVEIHAKTDQLRQEVEQGLQEATAGKEPHVVAHLDLDKEDFSTGLDSAGRDGKSFGSQKFTPRLDLDDGPLAEKFDANVARLNALADHPAFTVKLGANDEAAKAVLADLEQKLVDLNSKAYDGKIGTEGVDAVRAQIDDLEAKLDEFGARNVKAKVSVDGADKASSDFGALNSQTTLLVSSLELVAPALIPIGAAAVAGLGGIAAMAAQGVVGLGIFAAAAVPVITSLNKAADAQQKYAAAVQSAGANSTQANSALVAMHAAMDQLTPAEQKAAAALGDFKQQYQTWAKSFDPTILPLLSGGLNIARAAMSAFTPIVASVGGALKGVEAQILAVVSSSSFGRFSAIFGTQSVGAISTFGNLLVGVGKAFAGLDLAFQPLIVRMEGGLNHLATSLANFGAGASTNQGIQGFIAYVEREGPVVLDTILQIGKDIGILAKDLAPLGGAYLSGLDLLAKALGAIASFSPGLVEAGFALLSVGKAAQILNGVGSLSLVGSAIKDIGSVASTYGIRATAQGLLGLAGSAGGVVGALGAVGLTLGEVAGPAGIAVAALLSLTNVMSQGLDETAKGASQYVKAFVAGLQGVSDPVAAVNREIASLGEQSVAVSNHLDALRKAGDFGADWQNTVTQGSDLTDKMNDLKKILPGLVSDQNAFNAAQRAAAGGTSSYKAQLETLTSQMLAANSPQAAFAIGSRSLAQDLQAESAAISDLTNILNVLDGAYLSAQAATLAQKQATLSFSTALQAAHGDLTGNSQASITAQQSANSWATSLYNTVIPALVKNGDSAAQMNQITGASIAAFDGAAKAAGLTKPQIDALNATYKLTPKEVQTAIRLAGAAEVNAGLDQVQAKARAIAAATYTVTVYEKLATTFVPGALLPGAAKGSDFHPGGLSWVGEEGPEIVELPRGAKVVPNGKSMDMVRAGVMTPPGYAGGVGFDAMGFGVGNEFNSGLDRAFAGHPHVVSIVGGTGGPAGGGGAGGWGGTSGSFANNASWNPAGGAGAWGGTSGSFANNASWHSGAATGPAVDPFRDVTPAIIASVSSLLGQMRTVALDKGQQIIDAMTTVTTRLKNGTFRVSALPGNTVLDQAQIDAIASRLPKAIGAQIEKAGPLTVSQLKSLFAKLNADVPLSDINAIAKRLPSSIVAELEKAGPLTVAKFKSLADSLTKALNTAGDDLAKGLRGSMAQLTTYVGDAQKEIDKNFKGTQLQSIVDALGRNFDYLSSKAKTSLASITSQLAAAQAGLASIRQTISQNASSLEGQFNITQATGTTFTNPFNGSTWTAPLSGGNIIATLQADVKSLKTYKSLLDTLKGWGLSNELLAQLVAAGPAQGLATAQALVAGGKKEVDLADSLQGQIDATSTQIATISATAVIGGKQVGLSQAEGIVNGLTASKAKVTAELKTLAKDMQSVVERALDITGSSSGVFKGVGEKVIKGLLDGIKGTSGPLKAELEQVTKSLEDALGIHPAAGHAGAAGGGSGGTAWKGGWGDLAGLPKPKQKALSALGGGTLPGGSGGGVAPVTITNTYHVTGDVGPATVKLIKQSQDAHDKELMRWIGRF